MNQSANLHPLVLELMNDFSDETDRLSLTVDQFQGWHERLRSLSPAQRPAVTRDLVVLAARFQREAREFTDWAVHALMFFATQLSTGIQQAELMLSAPGFSLSAEALRLTKAAEAQKSAPTVRAGRSRSVDPMLQQQHFARRR